MNRQMTALAFDTHQAVKNLQQAGADEALAEAVVTTIGTALGESVATKMDIQEVKGEIQGVRGEIKIIKAEIQGVRGEIKIIKAEIKSSELRMTIRLGGMMVAVGGLIIAIIKLF